MQCVTVLGCMLSIMLLLLVLCLILLKRNICTVSEFSCSVDDLTDAKLLQESEPTLPFKKKM